MMKQKVTPEILRQREKESYKRLGFFMMDERVPSNAKRVFAKRECLSLLHRLVGDEQYDYNLRPSAL